MFSAMLEPLRYDADARRLQVLDQRQLPHRQVYVDVNDSDTGHDVIRNMSVRGAPAIALVAALSLSVELNALRPSSLSSTDLRSLVLTKLAKLGQARPTAVNLMRACNDIKAVLESGFERDQDVDQLIELIVQFSEQLLKEDRDINMKLSEIGANAILRKNREQKVTLLTHCNTGSLATSFYGTALGIIRKVHEKSLLHKAYCTETRPYNQGSRLTAFELVTESIPGCLICDSAAGALMAAGEISAVVVGADRVAANGDVANKIGTYNLAVLAKHHNVDFYVASPVSTLDPGLKTGASIPIEQRNEDEVVNCSCQLRNRVAAKG